MTPLDRVPAWGGSTATERVVDSLRFLRCHGFVSDRERDKIVGRVRKWAAQPGSLAAIDAVAAQPAADWEAQDIADRFVVASALELNADQAALLTREVAGLIHRLAELWHA